MDVTTLTPQQAEELGTWHKELMSVHQYHVINSGLVPVPGIQSDFIWVTRCQSCDNMIIGKALISASLAQKLM